MEKKIGLLIAISRELQAFVEANGDSVIKYDYHGRPLYHTKSRGGKPSIWAYQSGCGEIDAAAGTQLLISQGCTEILNFGVTGALDLALKVDDLFVVEKVLHYDFDTSAVDWDMKPHQYGEFKDEFIPLDERLIEKTERLYPGLRRATVASGDRFVADKAFKRELFAQGCQICDMEVAAIARVCYLSEVPCLSIKCISDTYDGDGSEFEANVKRSAQKAFEVLRGIIGS